MVNLVVYALCIIVLYTFIGWDKILYRYSMYKDRAYWTDYNIIEFAAWMSKAAIIIPGLIFRVEIWYLHFFTLTTSSLLVWASMKKNLPTLILFNTIWICISLTILLRNLI